LNHQETDHSTVESVTLNEDHKDPNATNLE